MAMDALKNLVNNIPNWQKRLDELANQVERRQVELAAVAAADPKGAETRSLRNTGSTESLKPRNEGPLQPNDPTEASDPEKMADASAAAKPSTPPPQNVQGNEDAPQSPVDGSPSATHKQARDNAVAAHSKARAQAQAKRRQRASSIISAEGAPAPYRTRSMIIVYYDSYVQNFFDELVRFTSSGRNLMRKAKMAAKVAQIKRLAEKEVPGEDGDDGPAGMGIPSIRYMSTRRMGPITAMSGSAFGSTDQKPDIYESLDKIMEIVQSSGEHGAHQFLRDADCNDEIQKIHKRLTEALEMAQKEIERIEREEPELAKETGDLGKARTLRPISMRREISTPQKDSFIQARSDVPELEAVGNPVTSNDTVMLAAPPLEVDTNAEGDEGIDIEQKLPKIQYRSTRHMGYRSVEN